MGAQPLTASKFWRSKAGWAAAVCFALVPPLLYLQLIRTTGANAHSNDYLFWMPLLDTLAGGEYPWSHYFKDTLQAGCHSYAFPILVTHALAQFTDWSIDATLYLTLVLSVLKLFVLHDALTGRAPRWVRQGSLVVLSALLFAPSNVNIYTFGFTATHIALTELGLVIAIWGVCRSPLRWSGLAIACAGALLASWSWGSGLTTWPLLAAALWLLGSRRPAHFAVLAGGFAIAVLPYLAYGNLTQSSPHGPIPGSPWWLLLEAPGLPFSGAFDHLRARISGAIVLVFLAAAAVWLHRGATARWRKATPALVCLAYGLGLLAPVVLLRGQLGSWYTSTFGFLWVGLVGVAAVMLESGLPLERLERRGLAAFGLAVTGLYAANGGYHDKVYYLQSRGPAAESCLRNYRHPSPTCERALFQWAGGHPEHIAAIAAPLERHQWGAFAPRQQWSLQGDYVLNFVSLERAPGASDVVWTPGLAPVKAGPTDYRRLNLFLPSPGSIHWPLTLPAGVERAVLRTAVGLSEAADPEARAAAARFEISVRRGEKTEALFTRTVTPVEHGWCEVELPLAGFAGQPITITLSSTAEGSAHPWAMFRFPVVELQLAPGKKFFAPPWLPPPRTLDDFVFDLKDSQSWGESAMTRDAALPHRWWVKWDPALVYLPPLDLCVDDYAYFLITAGASPNTFLRHMQVHYRLPADPGWSEARSFRVPMYGGPARTYLFSLRLLGLPQAARLSGLRIDPLDGPAPSGPTWADLSELRMVRLRSAPSACKPLLH